MTTDLFDLDGTVAVVTGGAGWLGTAMVAALAAAGADVIAVGRSAERLRTIADAVGSKRVETAVADVTTPAWPELVRSIGTARGRLDILVNNAHTGSGGSLRTSGPQAYLEATTLSVVASATGINAAREGFDASVALGGSPSVINIASMYGLVAPDPGMYDDEEGRNPPYYGAAKAGLLQLTRYAAAELGPAGIRVNAITPGPFPGPDAQQNAAFLRRLESRTLLNRVGTPEDLRTAVLFLASPASRFVTGSNIVVDGGWTAR